MKPQEMREMTLEELKIHHDSLIDELANLRIKLSIKQLDNPMRVRQLRREVARAKTILKEKMEGAMPGEKPGQRQEAEA
ncbi:MAG: 50S ribosomal protein L29 [Candidatus Latescibacteria bacterium]|nr:50S ribosomal protein L29 [Candidatus Latescibacterota bacterium]NIM20818.1 50S ribosomal protein L29 [Candidatus Latescibacterota bacterium]NIM64384.1 50S ribosomal protein L29 [Candidatus Latescibacterota bacterium]NIO00535.1 50S ribosomal protein L29 [Candidatus Latescibacterota bacterium]NIO26938.1 50S ribosomal protein L29 [Candidatus Latescibacterota bacterium]